VTEISTNKPKYKVGQFLHIKHGWAKDIGPPNKLKMLCGMEIGIATDCGCKREIS
jgi:hypothetical protein